MSFNRYPRIILDEITESMSRLDSDDCEQALELLESAHRIFVLGLGRLGFSLKSFAMRLMHMGREAYVVGETTTPNFGPGDLLVIGSASGETAQLTSIATKAKGFGGKVLALTGTAGSTITDIADVSIVIAAPSKSQADSTFRSVQPMASLFEQDVLVLGDSLILAIMDRSAREGAQMFTRHANLE
ncbi:6-phospho-3-hexuloisomerase [Glutamicibacter halophytocola]|uniref:6-phospho-3-hexuloisomerase n=1 Tax=Glutamicibacter halophytocola TaxID=1933880 RepID=UPI00321BB07B